MKIISECNDEIIVFLIHKHFFLDNEHKNWDFILMNTLT